MSKTTITIGEETISILKNFAKLQTSIVIDQGNEISVISSRATLLANAVVQEEFPVQFGIYDLNRFLSALSLAKSPKLLFDEGKEYVVITGEDGYEIKYSFSDTNNINVPVKKRLELPSEEIGFTLARVQLEKIKKTAAVLSLPDIIISSDGDGKIYLKTMDSSNSLSDQAKIELADAVGADVEFSMVFNTENINNILSEDYAVKISSKKISEFTALSNGYNITYWIAADINSKYSELAA